MKKILLCFCFFISALNVSSQIQRTFLGLTLGESKRSDVVNYAKSQGKSFEERDDKIYVNNVLFGGLQWSLAAFCFYKDILYMVSFSNDENNVPKLYLEKTWESLKKTLISKYGEYLLKNMPSDEMLGFFDTKTAILAKYNEFMDSSDKDLLLMYYDYELQELQSKSAEDEF